MKKILGKIVDSFTIMDVNRVVLLDRDCSAALHPGDSVTVTFPLGGSTTVKVLDALLEDAAKLGIQGSGEVTSIRVENIGFPEGSIQGCEVSLG